MEASKSAEFRESAEKFDPWLYGYCVTISCFGFIFLFWLCTLQLNTILTRKMDAQLRYLDKWDKFMGSCKENLQHILCQLCERNPQCEIDNSLKCSLLFVIFNELQMAAAYNPQYIITFYRRGQV